MQNETIDKLKNAGYITVTDDSQGIADAVGIDGGSGNFDEELAKNINPVVSQYFFESPEGEEYDNIVHLLGGIDGVVSVSLDDLGKFAQKVKAAEGDDSKLIDRISAALKYPYVDNQTSFYISIFDIQPDGLNDFKLNKFSVSHVSQSGERAIYPGDNECFIVYIDSSSGEKHYEPEKLTNFNDFISMASIWKNGQWVLDQSILSKWHGVACFDMYDSLIPIGPDSKGRNQYVLLAIWIDGESALQEENYEYYKYTKLVGLLFTSESGEE